MRSFPAVKAALTAISLATMPDGVQTGYSPRAGFSLSERVAFGDAAGVAEPITQGPARQMQEDYEIGGTISVTRNGTPDDQQTTNERAFALFDLLEVAVRSVPGMNAAVAGVQWAYVAGNWSLTEYPASETGGAVNATIDFRVRVRARTRLAL